MVRIFSKRNLLTAFILLHQQPTSTLAQGVGSKCQDSGGTFSFYGDDSEIIQVITASCWDVRRDTSLCEHKSFVNYCPVACGQCGGGGGGDVSESSCYLDLDLRFPKRKPDINYFYGSDTLVIKKKSSDVAESDVCSSFNKDTSWSCTHNGKAFVEYNRAIVGNYAALRSGEENVRISDVAGSRFRAWVQHNFTDKEVDQEPQSYRMDVRSKLTVKVNGKKKRKFSTRKNYGVPTHIVEDVFIRGRDRDRSLQDVAIGIPNYDEIPSKEEPGDEPRMPYYPYDEMPVEGGGDGVVEEPRDPDLSGYINPDYKGSYFVDIDCDDDCKCKFQKSRPRCEVTAKLTPGWSNFDRSETLSVKKEGSSVPPCSKENPKSWYCSHYGDALTIPVMITDYIVPQHQAAAVKIPNAARSTYVFSVTRDDLTPHSDGDINPFSLYIYTPSKVYGPLTGAEGASYYMSVWGMDCDKYCNCDAPYEMPHVA